MKFNEWINKTLTSNDNDLQPQDAAEWGWYACKKEIINLIKSEGMTMVNNYTLAEKIDKDI